MPPIYDGRWTMLGIRALRAFMRSKCAAEFLEQGELLAGKRPELCHAVLTHRRPIGVSPCGQKLRFCPIPLRTLGGFVGFASKS